ncbi:MAG: PASTA domain-containing protein [Nitrospirota bacterium]
MGIITAIVTMKILTSGKTVTVPAIEGKEVVSAMEILNNSGLKLRVEREEYHPSLPKGSVISQEPESGVVIKSGRSISVIVSRGSQTVVVPAVEGEPFYRAEIIIKQSGLDIGDIARIHTDKVEKDIVINQSPPPRSFISRGEKIDLLLSSGVKETIYKTPNLIGKRFEEAKQIAEILGVTLSKSKIIREGSEGNIIAEQKPVAGYPIRRGSAIEVFVAE